MVLTANQEKIQAHNHTMKELFFLLNYDQEKRRVISHWGDWSYKCHSYWQSSASWLRTIVTEYDRYVNVVLYDTRISSSSRNNGNYYA